MVHAVNTIYFLIRTLSTGVFMHCLTYTFSSLFTTHAFKSALSSSGNSILKLFAFTTLIDYPPSCGCAVTSQAYAHRVQLRFLVAAAVRGTRRHLELTRVREVLVRTTTLLSPFSAYPCQTLWFHLNSHRSAVVK